METFLTNILSFPTGVLTLLLGVMVVYWIFAILGMIDIDVLDFDVDMDTDVDLEGLTGLAGLMVTLGLTGVPFTIVLTLLLLFGWIICYFCVHFFFFWGAGNWLTYVAGIAVLPLSLAISIPFTAQIIKPLKPLFKKLYTPPPQKVLIGQTCIVRSSRVDEKFGEATAVLNGASLILRIRADVNKGLKNGDKVVMIEYRSDENSYWVIPEKEFISD